MKHKKVAVIGAGANGIASLKVCLDYGFETQCYEQSDNIGGIWRYDESSDTSLCKNILDPILNRIFTTIFQIEHQSSRQQLQTLAKK